MTALLNPSSTVDLTIPYIANRPLAERLAARVSCSLEEVVAFATVGAAIEAIAGNVLAGKRVTIARPAGDPIATAAWRSARTVQEVAARPFDGLVAAARDSDVLVLSSPIRSGNGASALLSPRELLLLRSRAPRPVIVLDLLDEDLARTPLTQPALLLPGTIILRGFGDLWRRAGAEGVADLAFVAGPRDIVAGLVPASTSASRPPSLAAEVTLRACEALDLPDIDRAVQAEARAILEGTVA